jgi:prophage regulatory protein
MTAAVIRFPQLQQLVGLSRVTVWRMENAQQFPRRIRLSTNSVGWKVSEIEKWLRTRERGQIRAPGGTGAGAP